VRQAAGAQTAAENTGDTTTANAAVVTTEDPNKDIDENFDYQHYRQLSKTIDHNKIRRSSFEFTEFYRDNAYLYIDLFTIFILEFQGIFPFESVCNIKNISGRVFSSPLKFSLKNCKFLLPNCCLLCYN